MSILNIYGVHTITLNRMKQTPYGLTPTEPVEIPGCFVVETQRLVRNSAGAEVLSTAQVAVPHSTPINLDEQPTVTLPSGRTGRVLSVSVGDAGGLPLPEHDVWALE